MSQVSTVLVPANQSGTDYRTLQNAINLALGSGMKGSSAPGSLVAGQLWIDDSANPSWVIKFYDGTDSITIGTVNVTSNTFQAAGLSSSAGYISTTFGTNYALTTGSTNAYVLTPSPARTGYTTGEMFVIKASFSNTAAATINISGLGAKAIKKNTGDDLQANDILSGQIVLLVYDGTNFQLVSDLALTYLCENLSAITTLQDADRFPFGDDSDSGKLKYIAFSDFKTQVGNAKYACLVDEKTTGTDGGTFTSGAWRTRDLNVEQSDTHGIVSLSANRFTLAAGSYVINAKCPAMQVNAHKGQLYNVTYSAAVALRGCRPAHVDNSSVTQTDAIIGGLFTITGTEVFEIQHQCATTKATNGFGKAAGFSTVEVYTQVELWKVA